MCVGVQNVPRNVSHGEIAVRLLKRQHTSFEVTKMA
jgi:hypothetical protein